MGNTSQNVNSKDLLHKIQKSESYKEFVEILTKNINLNKTKIKLQENG